MKAPDEGNRREKKDRVWIWLAVAVVLCVAIFLWRQGRARRLFEEARTLLSSRPEQAQELLEQSIVAAGGKFPEAQLLRCRALGDMNLWNEALGQFSLIDEPAQCPARDLLRLAQDAHRAGVEALALRALAAADRPGPEQLEAIKWRIGLELNDPFNGQALENCRRLERLDPDDPFPWQAEGQILRRTKQPLGAIRAYREALKRNPSEEHQRAIRVDMAGQLVEAGELVAARREIDRLLADPAAAEAVRMKDSYLLRLEGRTAEALDQINRVLTNYSDWTPALMLRGILYLDLERYGEAADDLSRVVAAQPFDKESRYKLAQAYARLDQPERAAQELEASRKLTDAEIEIQTLEPQLRRKRNDRELADRLVELYEQVGRSEDAQRLLRSPAAE